MVADIVIGVIGAELAAAMGQPSVPLRTTSGIMSRYIATAAR